MLPYQITSAIIGVTLAGAILYLVRRDHLHGPYALWWLIIAACTVLLGLFPQIIDVLARFTGISYGPTLALVVAIALVFFKMLKMDIDRSQQERKIRLLVQRMAVLEGKRALASHVERSGADDA